jgi:hypothetical protein
MWSELRCLMNDDYARISALACEIGMLNAHPDEKYDVVHRLIDLSAEADWMVREDVEDCLADYLFRASAIGGGSQGQVACFAGGEALWRRLIQPRYERDATGFGPSLS